MMIKHSNCGVDEVQILTNLYIFTCVASFTESIFIAEGYGHLQPKISEIGQNDEKRTFFKKQFNIWIGIITTKN